MRRRIEPVLVFAWVLAAASVTLPAVGAAATLVGSVAAVVVFPHLAHGAGLTWSLPARRWTTA